MGIRQIIASAINDLFINGWRLESVSGIEFLPDVPVCNYSSGQIDFIRLKQFKYKIESGQGTY